MSRGELALLGSGEFLPATEAVDRRLLAGRAQRVVFLPTAAGQEGAGSVQRWVDLGRRHYERLGVAAEPVLALRREDAEDPAVAAALADAGLVYFSGGDPGHLARTLVGSALGEAVVAAFERGAAVAGCSAGAMALCARVLDVRQPGVPLVPGLGLVPDVVVLPHHDRARAFGPRLLERIEELRSEGTTVLGLDEETAVVGVPGCWEVVGRRQAWWLRPEGRRDAYRDGRRVAW